MTPISIAQIGPTLTHVATRMRAGDYNIWQYHLTDPHPEDALWRARMRGLIDTVQRKEGDNFILLAWRRKR